MTEYVLVGKHNQHWQRSKTLKHHPNYNFIHSSSYRDPAVGEEWSHRFFRAFYEFKTDP